MKGWFEHSVLFLKSGKVICYSLSGLQFFSRFVQLTSSILHYLSWTSASFKLHELKHRESYVTVLFSNSAVSQRFNKMWKVVTRHFSLDFFICCQPPAHMTRRILCAWYLLLKASAPKHIHLLVRMRSFKLKRYWKTERQKDFFINWPHGKT